MSPPDDYRIPFVERKICEVCGGYTFSLVTPSGIAPGNCLLGMGDIEPCPAQEWFEERKQLRSAWRSLYPEHHCEDGSMKPGGLSLILVAERLSKASGVPIFKFIPRDFIIQATSREDTDNSVSP
jgi:hypothetical protein